MGKGTIIYVGNFELPDKNAAANRVMNNGKIFRALGYRVVYLGTVRGESFNGVRKSGYDDNIFEEAYPTTTKLWVKHIFDITNVENVASHFNDIRLIITYNMPYATFKAIKRAFQNTAIKIAYDCTEWNNFAEGPLPKRLYKRLDEFEIRYFLGKKNDNLIVISKLMEDKYKGCNLIKLPPVIDIVEPIWHQKHIEHLETFEFCFAGTITNKERLDRIVEVFCKIDNPTIRLRIIGITKDEYKSAYPEQENMIDADRRVLFMGKLPHEETIRHTLSCDCYIFIRETSRKNMAGFPTKFVEAFTCGVPIISTDVSDIKEFADERVFLLDSTSEQKVLDAMKKVSESFNGDYSLNKNFDYRNYLSESENWLEDVLK